jgi:hypothetical protein
MFSTFVNPKINKGIPPERIRWVAAGNTAPRRL